MEAEEAPSLIVGKAWFWAPILPLLLLDLWSKHAVFAFLKVKSGGVFDEHVYHEVWSGIVSFRLVNWTNHGTIWGLGQDWHEYLKYLRCVALLVILLFVFKTSRRCKVQLLALGAILAGALGNLYDNFIHVNDRPEDLGAVRDFLLFFREASWTFPAFNVADACISVGAFTLLALLLRPGARR